MKTEGSCVIQNSMAMDCVLCGTHIPAGARHRCCYVNGAWTPKIDGLKTLSTVARKLVDESIKRFRFVVVWYLPKHPQPEIGSFTGSVWNVDVGKTFAIARKATRAEGIRQLKLHKEMFGMDGSSFTKGGIPYVLIPISKARKRPFRVKGARAE